MLSDGFCAFLPGRCKQFQIQSVPINEGISFLKEFAFLSQNNGLIQVEKNRSFVSVCQSVVLGEEKQIPWINKFLRLLGRGLVMWLVSLEWWNRPKFLIHVLLKSGFLFVRKSVVEQEFISEFRIQKAFHFQNYSAIFSGADMLLGPISIRKSNFWIDVFFGWDFRINPKVNFRINQELPQKPLKNKTAPPLYFRKLLSCCRSWGIIHLP